jgi:hypothetical protein
MTDVMYYYKNNYFVALAEEDFSLAIAFRVRALGAASKHKSLL